MRFHGLPRKPHRPRKASGVFFAPLEFERDADKTNRAILAALGNASIPVVLLDHRHAPKSEPRRLDLVGLNNRQAGYNATRHLIQFGCTRIGFLGYHGAPSTVAARLSGYEAALRDHGLPLVEADIVRSRAGRGLPLSKGSRHHSRSTGETPLAPPQPTTAGQECSAAQA